MRFFSVSSIRLRRFRPGDRKLHRLETRAAAVITLKLDFLGEHTMTRAIRLAIIAIVLTGCGLKGPLTMPEPDSNTQKEQKK
jgi:Prokaryotic lipoprotein-attachment site